MITFKQKGDFSRTKKFLERIKHVVRKSDLDKYGRMGVEALELATPRDSGETAKSWSYEIKIERDRSIIEWHNSNMTQGVPVVILLEYGHATESGYFVKANDFVNPAMKPVFDKIGKMAWEEVDRG